MTYIDRQIIPWVDSLPSPGLVPQWRGEWEAVPYEIGDVVRYNTALFITVDRTLATETPANSDKWKPMVGGLISQTINHLSNTQLTTESKVVSTDINAAITLAEAVVVYSLTSSVDGRIRMYASLDSATQDVTREPTQYPAVPIVLDVTVKANAPFSLSPVAHGYNSAKVYYLRIEPAVPASTAVVSLTILAQNREEELLNV